MKKKLKETLKKNRGITLIALVITIIVLLILAGVTIATLTGENGILNKSSQSKIEQSHSSVKEQTILALDELYLDKHDPNTKNNIGVIDFLTSKGYIESVNNDAYYKVTEGALTGATLGKGTSKENGDIYVIEEDSTGADSETNYVLRYYETADKYKTLLKFTQSGLVKNETGNEDGIISDGAGGEIEYSVAKPSSNPKPENITTITGPNNTDDSESSNPGESESNPLYIYYIEDLVELSKNCGTYNGKYITLANSLDFEQEICYKNYATTKYGDINGDGKTEGLKTELTTGKGFTPIASFSGTFDGLYDGKNHAINNIHIDGYTGNAGLFGNFSGTIKNLGLSGENAIIRTAAAPTSALIATGNNVTIENCCIKVNVTANTFASAFIGQAAGNINISNSYNIGNITSTNSTPIGGFIGFFTGGNITIQNCKNLGTVNQQYTGTGSPAGGIIGIINNAGEVNISNTKNVASIITSFEIPVGGIIGYSDQSKLILNYCDNEGDMEANGYVAGLVGQSSALEAEITNSNNKGQITGNGNYNASGIINFGGYGDSNPTLKISITNCSNYNTIKGPQGLVSGITNMTTDQITMSGCQNTGELVEE